jgi:ribosomal protein S18 acetylase RimI-like enzyme
VEIVEYTPERLDEVLRIAKAEGWVTFSGNPRRAARAMSAPGVTALVAVERETGTAGGSPADGRVIGFSQAVGDGAITGYLCMLLVAEEARGRGVGKALVDRTLVESGVLRLDLLSSERAIHLYERFNHSRYPGFRLYAGD